jgi:predicted O-methyltransferase YrrM
MPIDARRRALAAGTKGFMPLAEGDALHAAAIAAVAAVPGAPIVEVGSYCGRSTIWLGDAAEQGATVVFAVDHHHGSEENQAGWEHHDTSLVDPASGQLDTLPRFREAIAGAGLDASVVAMVGDSPTIGRNWSTPLSLLFVDGGHGVESAAADFETWTPHVAVGGALVIHDVFPDPADGGRPPYEQIYLPALRSGVFELASVTGSLRVLTRLRAGQPASR